MYEKPIYRLCGDSALSVEFSDKIEEEAFLAVKALMNSIEASHLSSVKELVPTYRSLFVSYDPLSTDYNSLLARLEKIGGQLKKIHLQPISIIEIPVVYGGNYGPDIENVARHNSITANEVAAIHCSRDYPVYMLGFTPGFPYLGEVDSKISSPRLTVPRLKIPSGSVGIAGSQTGIYPIESPGGWQLIGRTPLTLFDPYLENPFLLKPGMYVRFKSITERDYINIKSQVDNKIYMPVTYRGS